MESHDTLSIIKKPNQPIYSEDPTETNYDSFIPMITNFSTPKTDDSRCTRCVRKKFVCIIVFLISIIACCQLLNTILSKIALNDVDNVSQLTTKVFSKLFTTKYNVSTDNAKDNGYASTYVGRINNDKNNEYD